MKELSEDSDWEKVARETVVKTAKEKIKAADTAEKKAAAAEKAKALAEKRSAELLAKQNETDLKLAKAVSLNTTQAEELANLRVVLEACEEKWYNEGFADAENSVEPVVNQARRLGFEASWFTTMQVMGVPEDSPLRDPGQIPFPISTPAVQNPPAPIDEEETTSMRELMEQIDAHVELDDMEATSIPRAGDQLSRNILPPVADQQQTDTAPQTDPIDRTT